MAYNNRVQIMDRFRGIIRFPLVFAFLFCALFVAPVVSFAEIPDVSVTPVVIDGKGKVREILRFNVALKNTSSHLSSIYAWVTDIDANSGSVGDTDLEGSHEKDLGESLARWVQITRGSIDLLPGEEKEIPITVQINLTAKPGVYHAVIHLSEGSDRASAEANPARTQDVVVNIEVLEDINERLQLSVFSPVKNIFSDKTALFQYKIENIGNRGEIPRGKVRIFDRDGREVAAIEANLDGTRLEPSTSAMLSSVWMAGGSFGKYKAMLDIEYGSRGTLQDTVFFWMIPWGKLASMFFTLVLACVIIAVVIHSRISAGRGELELSPTFALPKRRSFFRRVTSLWSDDDEYIENEPQERSASRGGINEMREVVIPHPVHSRLPRVEEDISLGVQRKAPASLAPSSSHQVTLPKREKHSSPNHVVNLRK